MQGRVDVRATRGDAMNECLKCGMAGARHTTHVCITAGAYDYAPAHAEAPWRPLEPWVLAERYGDHRTGFWLGFKSGDRRLDVEVTKEQWDAFGS